MLVRLPGFHGSCPYLHLVFDRRCTASKTDHSHSSVLQVECSLCFDLLLTGGLVNSCNLFLGIVCVTGAVHSSSLSVKNSCSVLLLAKGLNPSRGFSNLGDHDVYCVKDYYSVGPGCIQEMDFPFLPISPQMPKPPSWMLFALQVADHGDGVQCYQHNPVGVWPVLQTL